MDVHHAILKRRSIRKFSEIKISKEIVEQIVTAGLLSPSSKNRQPWRFVIVQESAKPGMLNAMAAGLEREKKGKSNLPGCRQFLSGAEQTLKIMETAPTTVFVINPLNRWDFLPTNLEEQFSQMANIQSIGAAIENMLLTATSLGIGTLWNCDIYFAYPEICQWLNTEEQVIAAISMGYSIENPSPRPRKSLEDTLQWLI
ncbi:nitroreductase family protein [Clostridium minihomine]|uniref:nitroreductase family protein n=1 Tax=Clostridium minihomine TaxID=2045012 RepID=UPI000C761F57|nr:nitroreductase family protein [Clostridium minihomine]